MNSRQWFESIHIYQFFKFSDSIFALNVIGSISSFLFPHHFPDQQIYFLSKKLSQKHSFSLTPQVKYTFFIDTSKMYIYYPQLPLNSLPIYLILCQTLILLLQMYSLILINIPKTKIMASGPITSWQIDGETVEIMADFILGGSKNHCTW